MSAASALLKRYVDEPDSDEAEALLQSDPSLVTARTLDALHLAAAQRAGVASLLTFDLRQAQAARNLGLTVVGA